MNNITYIEATVADIPTLIDSRTAFRLVELCGAPGPEELTQLREQLETYLEGALPNKTYFGYLAKDGDKTVSTGGMTIREQPGSFKNPSGRMAYIMNMYTIPEYRRQGLCTKILELLTIAATNIGISVLELHATKAGEPVYQKSGFKMHLEPTYRKHLLTQ